MIYLLIKEIIHVFRHIQSFALILLLAITSLTFVGCGNDDDEPHSEHAEAEGLVLRASGQTIVSYFQDEAVNGEIVVAVNAETDLLTVRFYDHDQDEFVPEDADSHISLVIADESIAEIEQHAGEDWSFHVVGKNRG